MTKIKLWGRTTRFYIARVAGNDVKKTAHLYNNGIAHLPPSHGGGIWFPLYNTHSNGIQYIIHTAVLPHESNSLF